MLSLIYPLLCLSNLVLTHVIPTQEPLQSSGSFIQKSIFAKRPDILAAVAEPEFHTHDEYTTSDTHAPYEGIASFAHLNITNCFSAASDGVFDIGIVGAPFDLGVTYRPGARFGPAGARMGARRLSPSFAYRYGGTVVRSIVLVLADARIAWTI